MIRAILKSPWSGNGFPGDATTPPNPFRPRISDAYSLVSVYNLDGHSGLASVFTLVEIVCDDATWAAIQADPVYNTGIRSFGPA